MSLILYNEPDIVSVSMHTVGKTIVQKDEPTSDFLRLHGIEPSQDEEGQALRSCPPTVRLAIASHYTWWFLARSHSFVVRTLAHAYVQAMHYSPNPGLQCIKPLNQTLPRIAVVEGRDKRPFAILPYRILNYFSKYLHDAGASGPKANLMDKKQWDQDMRPNCPPCDTSRSGDPDRTFGCAGRVHWSDYNSMDWNGGLVRSSMNRMLAFCEGVRPAMQPFLTTQFMPTSPRYERLRAPGVWVQRPRSGRLVAMIPRGLAHGMEQVAGEVPFAVRYVQHRHDWMRMVQEEAARYADRREELALVAMSKRANLTEFLAHYDATAAVGYAMPAIESYEKEIVVGETVMALSFPGLNTHH